MIDQENHKKYLHDALLARIRDCIVKACSLQAERNETYRLKILFEKKRHETLKG